MHKQKRKKDELRKLAGQAKKRLKNGYWNEVKSERGDEITKAECEGRDPQAVKEYYRHKLSKEFSNDGQTEKNKDDEIFYKKVVAIITSEELVTNPIALLKDDELYKAMDTGSRQRYILAISEKYRAMRDRYEQEQALLKQSLVH
jgi:hypothetical protein